MNRNWRRSRGPGFVRYADDFVAAVKTEVSATRVMVSVTQWIERKPGLKAYATKTKICGPWQTKYPGFCFCMDKSTRRWTPRPHANPYTKFKKKIRECTRRSWSVALDDRLTKLCKAGMGWINRFAICAMRSRLREGDRRAHTNGSPHTDMEAMESARQKTMGTAKNRS